MSRSNKEFIQSIISEIVGKFNYVTVKLEEEKFEGYLLLTINELYEEDYSSFDELHTQLQVKYSGADYPPFMLGVDVVISSKATEGTFIYPSILGMEILETQYVGALAWMNLFNQSVAKNFKYTLENSLLNGFEPEEEPIEAQIPPENTTVDAMDKQLALAA